MRLLILLFLTVTLTTGFNSNPIPTPERLRILQNSVNDSFSTMESQCFVSLSTFSRKDVLTSLKISLPSETVKREFCVLQGGINASKTARRDFQECLEEIGDCEKSFDVNRRGDWLVECVEG